LPSASEAIAAQLRDGGPVRIRGNQTKPWGTPIEHPPLDTTSLNGIVSHDAGDFTAVLQAGVPLAEAQAAFAEKGQMLALDPPAPDATIGGVVATADSGPLRHRYGSPRDLVIGMTLALADGSVARSGGRVIKNVAGYDLPKLAAGSFGTLGVITEVCVRLHPKPDTTATAVFRHDHPHLLQARAIELNSQPLEAEALDVNDHAVLVRFGGSRAAERAHDTGGEVVTDDDELWARQRDGQRGELVVRVAGLPTDLARILTVARDVGATVVGRAGVGTTWLNLPPDTDIAALRAQLEPHPVVITDAPESIRRQHDPWHIPDGPELDLMRSVRRRFDPDNRCNPGLYV
jgi:glycolate oxidase FAD binding subunit